MAASFRDSSFWALGHLKDGLRPEFTRKTQGIQGFRAVLGSRRGPCGSAMPPRLAEPQAG